MCTSLLRVIGLNRRLYDNNNTSLYHRNRFWRRQCLTIIYYCRKIRWFAATTKPEVTTEVLDYAAFAAARVQSVRVYNNNNYTHDFFQSNHIQVAVVVSKKSPTACPDASGVIVRVMIGKERKNKKWTVSLRALIRNGTVVLWYTCSIIYIVTGRLVR